jgi:hypothetical protein
MASAAAITGKLPPDVVAGSAYHFDLDGPLSLEMAEASAEAAGVPLGSPEPWRSHDWHPDQLQLIRELGQDSAK